jgi:hypothetical protein
MAGETNIPVQNLAARSKIDTITWTAATLTAKNSFINDGKTILLCKNCNAATRTVTVKSVADEDARTGDISVTVPAFSTPNDGFSIVAPTSPRHLFNRASDGVVIVECSAEADLYYAAVRLPI